MWRLRSIKSLLLSSVVFLFLSTNLSNAQQFSLTKNRESKLIVYGTSNIHDWEVVAESFEGTLLLTSKEAGLLEKLTVQLLAEGLKSGKSGMDKNTYKALKTNTHKHITFKLKGVTEVVEKTAGIYTAKTTGDLTIAGVTNTIPLSITVQVKGNEVQLSGSKAVKMTDYGVEPPKALLGTIKTGDEVTIKFNVILYNQ